MSAPSVIDSADLLTLRRILARRFRVGATVHVDLMRPELEAAQIRPNQYGPLFGAAVKHGWLTVSGLRSSNKPSRRGGRSLSYKRQALR